MSIGILQIKDCYGTYTVIKYRIRKETISYSKRKARDRRDKLSELEKSVKEWEEKCNELPTAENLAKLEEQKIEYEAMYDYITQGAMIRSRARWYEKGEKSNSYFLRLENFNHNKSCIRKIKQDDGNVITEPAVILNQLKSFYSTLYQNNGADIDQGCAKIFLGNPDIPKLDKQMQMKCEGKLTFNECYRSLLSFQNGKAPGNDGLTVEFYKAFWPVIGNLVVGCLNAAHEHGELSTSQKMAIIKLIEKKDKDKMYIANWRPISLINVDVKIASKALAKRLECILPFVIHRNQNAYVKGRLISDSTRIIDDIMSYTKVNDLSGLLVAIDFEKAFDSLDWAFLNKALLAFNFGESFIKWVSTFYCNIKSCVTNNGFSSIHFDVKQGVRQGDPLSPYLFIIALEILAINIRSSKNIKGFKLSDNEEIKLTIFADDLTTFLKDKQSFENLLKMLRDFGCCSGLKVNNGKLEALHLGDSSIKLDIGVFAAAHDLKTEWVVVKGIKDYADGSQSSNDQRGTFACVMAASVVANILSDPVIFEEWPHYSPDANGSLMPAVSAYTSALKASIGNQTEFQPKLMASPTISNLRTDDIFTNLLIQHGRKTLFKNDMTSARGDLLDYYGQVSGTLVKRCEEIFVCSTEGEPNPKSILVTGKAGIGKTLFSQKLVRDWADGKLFQSQANLKAPDINFAYLLTFRQLNLLGNDRFSLRELLNCSSVLDENSNLDNSLFEYLVNHPEEVLIILDGYDEYSQQDYIASSSEEQYPNNAREEMPVAALCAKLIKGKMMRESVVMITSRPDESDKMGGIQFDRYVEITGFSPEQVEEYIVKYFKENETMKNTVLEHVMNNENLVSFAHIPVLCFLMCFYLEYTLQESKSTALPVSATDIYSEVVNIFELKHNAESEYKTKEIPEKHKATDVIESTLDKLSELAAQLLLQQRPIFDERDMKKKFKLEEIEKLKGSGLLHCGPPFRKSAFETTKQLSFTHLTIQEFLAARWFVMRNEIPTETVSEMVMLFIAGILSKKRDDKLMERLLENISITTKPVLVRAKLLSEYQDKDFAKNVIINHPQHYSYMNFTNLNDVDCIAISFLLDVISELNEEEAATAQHERSEQSFNVNSLAIIESALTLSGIKRICKSLKKEHCAVTKLFLLMAFNHFSDTVIIRLCETLQHPSCKVNTLYLGGDQITDTGVARLCEALQHSSCKVTALYLGNNQITDTGVTRLCKALQHPSCKVTTLHLSGNQITDTGVASLCEALQHPSCNVTTLYLCGNQITDTGVTRSCKALQRPSCNVTTLDLRDNQITDTGVTSLCKALKHSNCKLTSLCLWDIPISEESKESLRTLVQQHRPGFELDI
ncbi:hypothetical protein ACROYT_G029135 [Oculina patagonica]